MFVGNDADGVSITSTGSTSDADTSILDDLRGVVTDANPVWETAPARRVDADDDGVLDESRRTDRERFDQPIDATDPSNITVEGPLGDVAGAVEWIGNHGRIVIGFVVFVGVLYLLQPVLEIIAGVTAEG